MIPVKLSLSAKALARILPLSASLALLMSPSALAFSSSRPKTDSLSEGCQRLFQEVLHMYTLLFDRMDPRFPAVDPVLKALPAVRSSPLVHLTIYFPFCRTFFSSFSSFWIDLAWP